MGRMNHIFPSLINEVVPGPSKNSLPSKGVSSVRYEIRSTMRTGIFWRNALGLMVSEPAALSTTAPEYIYITIEYEFDSGVRIDARELLSEKVNDTNHAEYQGVVKALTELESNPTWNNHRKFSYTVGISREALDSVGGVAYLNDVDMVVGLDEHRESIHPYSAPGQRQQISDILTEEDGCIQRYLVVDNSSIYGTRWVNTGVRLFELRPMQIPHLDDGVYVTTSTGLSGETKTEFYKHTDADKALGLYRNRAEAETYGAPEARFKAELKERENELAIQKLSLAQEKQDMDSERQSREEHYKNEDLRRKREKEDMDADRTRREEEYKNEDLRRKREKEDMEVRAHRHKEDMERQRERLNMERERIEFDRKTQGDHRKFEYEQLNHGRREQTDALKYSVEIAKMLLSMAGVGLGIAALVVKKAK